MYNSKRNIRFQFRISSLCDYSDALTIVKGRIIITGPRDDAAGIQTDG